MWDILLFIWSLNLPCLLFESIFYSELCAFMSWWFSCCLGILNYLWFVKVKFSNEDRLLEGNLKKISIANTWSWNACSTFLFIYCFLNGFWNNAGLLLNKKWVKKKGREMWIALWPSCGPVFDIEQHLEFYRVAPFKEINLLNHKHLPYFPHMYSLFYHSLDCT